MEAAAQWFYGGKFANLAAATRAAKHTVTPFSLWPGATLFAVSTVL